MSATQTLTNSTIGALRGKDTKAYILATGAAHMEPGESPEMTGVELSELPERDNGFAVYAKCRNCGINLTISSNQWFVHVTTYDRSCRVTRLADPDRHQRWAKH